MVLPFASIPAAPAENEPANAAHESAETLALLARRRSTKIALMGAPGPSDSELDALIKLGARVPDHGKLGPWRFVVINGEGRARAGEMLAQLRISRGDGEEQIKMTRDIFLRAPACVMVVSTASEHPKIPQWEQLMSAGAACFALLLSAHALGYAGAWLTEWPTYDADARAALGLATHERIAGFVYLGTAREGATERVRADAAARVTRF